MCSASVVREVRFDSQKRLQLWQERLANYSERERLSSFFSFKNVDAALQDFNELIHGTVLEEADTQKVLLAFFHRIHDVLKAELHAIKLIRQKPGNARELLLLLFQLIFQREAVLYNQFNPSSFRDKLLADKVGKVASAILLEQEIKEEVNTDENEFVRRMITGMGNTESKNRYRALAESIYAELLEKTGAPWRNADEFERGFREFEELIGNDGALAGIISDVIRERRFRYRQEDIPFILKAFRQSYNHGHFEDLESEFST